MVDNFAVTGAPQGAGLGIFQELSSQDANVIMFGLVGENLSASAARPAGARDSAWADSGQ